MGGGLKMRKISWIKVSSYQEIFNFFVQNHINWFILMEVFLEGDNKLNMPMKGYNPLCNIDTFKSNMFC